MIVLLVRAQMVRIVCHVLVLGATVFLAQVQRCTETQSLRPLKCSRTQLLIDQVRRDLLVQMLLSLQAQSKFLSPRQLMKLLAFHLGLSG